ncbi:MAG TPA: ribonuclease E/G [Stellaceae bacterium]|nr:ribonuclease E/G [Stellaceae bacterium]
MAKRMLIDSMHPEETRVVVLSGNRLEEFDFETSIKKQIKGNIYLAKVTRVEPSLQAAFVDYGGNRHGFLAFSEIHSDYYRIPVGDRPPERFHPPLRERGRLPSEIDAESDAEMGSESVPAGEHAFPGETSEAPHEAAAPETNGEAIPEIPGPGEVRQELTSGEAIESPPPASEPPPAIVLPLEEPPFPTVAIARIEAPTLRDEPPSIEPAAAPLADDMAEAPSPFAEEAAAVVSGEAAAVVEAPPPEIIETLGGDEIEEASRQRARRYRPYKIQEVVKRRQIMLVQVTKEERGNKGAALTTYLSLAGRYCVLMPNTDRGGGVSRKITSASDRKRLKELVEDLQVPEGMGVIVRTAGSERSKAEIKRDFEYLIRLWDEIRELTLKSTAPALIYEEGNLIKRAIRDLYARDIDEIVVEGEEGYKSAKSFMRMLMPSHAKRVHNYRDPTIPLFQRFQVESQIDAIHSPVVQLRSGGYIVINQTEALVAIDVNSGRATRERNIEETALKTNCEAAEEIARQLRLRDLAGLIVIDFIDMEEHRNQVTVERRLKEAMKHDRARIQVGRISAFGLLELSRQRLRPSIVEVSTQPCPHCGGTGHIRSTESTALHVLRAIEEEGMRRRSAEISVAVPANVALYILNQKRAALTEAEQRYHFRVAITSDDTLIPPNMRLERVRALTPEELAALPPLATQAPSYADEEDEADDTLETEVETETTEPVTEVSEAAEGGETHMERSEEREPRGGHGGEEGRGGRRRRRRRRRRVGGEDGREAPLSPAPVQEHRAFAEAQDLVAEEIASGEAAAESVGTDGEHPGEAAPDANASHGDGDAQGRRRRRRGRRGGRRRRRGHGEAGEYAPHQAGHPESEFHPQDFHEEHEPEAPFTAAEHPTEAPRAHEAHAWTPAPEVPMAVREPEPPAPAVAAAEVAPPAPPPPAEPEQTAAGAVNVPPPITVSERPAKPRRGWWGRLTQG